MRLIAKLLVTTGVALLLPGCRAGDAADKPEYVAVQVEQDDNWSFMAPDGSFILKEKIEERPSAVLNGMFNVLGEDGYGLYSLDDDSSPVLVCEDLADVGYCTSDGLIPLVRRRERISVIDREGDTRFVLEPAKRSEIVRAHNSFHDGMLLVCDFEGKYGYVNTSGDYIVAPRYDGAMFFSEGYALVCVKRDAGDRYHLIDTNGDEVLTLKKGYEPVSFTVRYGMIAVKNGDGRIILVSVPSGDEHKCPAKVKNIHEYDNRYYVYSNDDLEYGLMKIDGDDQVLRSRFSYINFGVDNTFVAGNNKGNYIYNGEGEEKSSLGDYRWVESCGDFGLFAYDGEYYQGIDDKGKLRKNMEFCDMNTSPTVGGELLSSDYFDFNAVANAVVDMINSDGIARYRLQAPAADCVDGDAKDYTSVTKTQLGDLTIKGYMYDVSVSAFFTGNIALSRYANSDPYDYSRIYFWNPDSRLNEICIGINTECPYWSEEGNDVLCAALKAKGFNEVASTSKGTDLYRCLLRKGRLYAYINGSSDTTGSNVYFALATPDEEQAIIRRINDINSGND